LFIILTGLAITTGAVAGYASGRNALDQIDNNQQAATVTDQYQLALIDMSEGRYEIARQRLEYVIKYDPDYPGASDKLAETLLYLYATATPSAVPATSTPQETTDPRPAQELFSQAENSLANHNWQDAISTLLSLRKENPDFQTARVDGMLYIALRYLGVEKILNEGNLQGGMYDLTLAENIGPLDFEASRSRSWARLYIIGTSFWEAYPEQAVYYFSQVASAAPYLRDASGWTSIDRYRGALIQYGDWLAQNEDWCSAQTQYETAYSIRADGELENSIEDAALRCAPPTETAFPTLITPTVTGTYTGTLTTTPSGFWTPIATTQTPLPSPTSTPSTTAPSVIPPTATTPVMPIMTPTPSPTPSPPPSTPTPTPTSQAPDQSTQSP
jgi:tetratricopeptide (TPR) repeat protein